MSPLSRPTVASSSGVWLVTGLYMVLSVAVMVEHVRADSTNSTQPESLDFIGRFTAGPEHLTTFDMIVIVFLGIMSMESMNFMSYHTGTLIKFDPVPVRGKHLDELTTKDKLYIAFSKLQTGPFVYFLLRYALYEPNILWMPEDLSFQSVLLPIPILLIIFDFFYTTMHWFLHIKAVYGYVHKHHHVQKAPSRANEDGINVHPLEFILGEYNHLWSFFLCCHVFQMKVHVASALLFLSIGALLAGWNHTRYDIVISVFGITLYDSKAHDVHHRIPQSNYGQYTMFWDHVFGTYREYDPTDRVNPKAQLDPRTGKSYEHAMAKAE